MSARALQTAGALVVILLLGAAVDLVLLGPAREIDRRITSVREDLEIVQRRVAAATSRLKASTNGVATDAAIAVGGDPAEVVAGLQEQTRTTLGILAAMTLSSQVVTTELGGGYRRVSLLLHAQLTEQSLLSFLQRTEAVLPLVLVESLDVRMVPVPTGTLPLDVTATLTTFQVDNAAT